MSNSTRRPSGPIRASLRQRRAHVGGQIMLTIGEANDLRILDLDWSDLDPGTPTRICRSDGRILPEACFRSWGMRHGSMAHFSPDCVICEHDFRWAYIAAHVFEVRAKAVLTHHMRVERKQGLHRCTNLAAYILLTGVTIEWLADKMRHAYEANERCEHCESAGLTSEWQAACPVVDGIVDLSRMTVDRTDPTRLLARDNLTLMCLKGNIAKHETDPHTYNIRQAYWRLHNAQRAAG